MSIAASLRCQRFVDAVAISLVTKIRNSHFSQRNIFKAKNCNLFDIIIAFFIFVLFFPFFPFMPLIEPWIKYMFQDGTKPFFFCFKSSKPLNNYNLITCVHPKLQ